MNTTWVFALPLTSISIKVQWLKTEGEVFAPSRVLPGIYLRLVRVRDVRRIIDRQEKVLGF